VLWIKICGFCDTESAGVAADLGADAIGLNFVSWSKRFIDAQAARDIANAQRGRVELVGIVEGMTIEQAARLRDELCLDRIQFHGGLGGLEGLQLPDWAYMAVGISNAADAQRLLEQPGERLLVDTVVSGASGGTGVRFDWSLVEQVARSRNLVVAGGLTPDNVAEAVRQVRPFGVDVASGVEVGGRAGRKDAELMRRFIQSAREADCD
jgi:phosphoribosylanthranilate isomerase